MLTTNQLLQDMAYNLYLVEFRLRMGRVSAYQPVTKEEYLKGWKSEPLKKKKSGKNDG